MVTNVLVFRPPAENSARGEEESGTLSPSHPHTLTPPIHTPSPLPSTHPHSSSPFFLHLLSLLSLPPPLPTLSSTLLLSLPFSFCLPFFLLPPPSSLLPPPSLPLPPPSLPLTSSSLPSSSSSLPPSSSFLQLNEVMEKETYNTAREILERFDPSHPSLRAPNPATQNQERQQNTPRSGSGQSCVASIEIPTVATVESKLLN